LGAPQCIDRVQYTEARGSGVCRVTNRSINRATTLVGALLLFLATLVAPAYPAFAAVTTEPVAIAVGRDGDGRVLHVGGDGSSNSSPIVVAPYVANTAAGSTRQRWIFERVTGSGMPTFAYRIKNPATGKCLNAAGGTPVNEAPIILFPCNGTLSGTNEIWWMDSSPDPTGVHIRNKRDNRCVDIASRSSANNARLVNYTCNEVDTAWNQIFQVRTGSFYCTERQRDWGATAGLCVSPTPTSGIMGAWFNVPSTIAYKNPSTYVLSNELRSRIKVDVLDADNIATGEVQMGWRALRAPTTNGTVSYNAYWEEWGQDGEEYHTVPPLDPIGRPNGSQVADGTQHTYMMLASSTAGQWDLFYDFNYFATTQRQSGNRAGFVTVGLQSRYIDALTQAQPYDFRVQTTNVAGVWVKPELTQAALGNSKECGMFPVWEDFSGGTGNNQPPWCLTTARTLTDTKTAVEVTSISKPTSAVSLAGPRRAAKVQERSGVVNGVDQAQLSRCMAEDPARCLQTVSGLERCVQKRLLCSVSPAAKHTIARSRVAMTGTDAIAVARSLLRTEPADAKTAAAEPQVTRTTIAGAGVPEAAGSGLAADTQVYVVTGRGPVRSWNANSATTYGRWTAVVDATTSSVLYARLGEPQ
jgi:hypothetical protein